MRTYTPWSAPQRRRPGGKPSASAVQAVGLPGSQGWLARMQGHGPDGRAQVMHTLQQSAGNRAVARSVFGDLFKESAEALVDRAMCFTLRGSVGGREADNHPEDVGRVRARLKTLGYPTTDDPATLVAAIERYQRDVVGLKRPDGRIDPAGRTLTALNAGKAAAPVGAPAVPGAAPPELPAAPDKAEPAAPAATTSTAAPAAGPPADLQALAARSPALKGALDGIERLRGLAATAQQNTQRQNQEATKAKQADKQTQGQEWGAERDKLVAEIKVVRKAIDDLKSAGGGLTAAELASVLAYLYRELARIAPYYFQMVNANILEKGGKAGGRTCNVTSLSMTLEALGKSAKDYAGPEVALMPQIANVLPERIGTATDRVEGEEEMHALRLPDFLQLLVIAKSFNALKLDPALAVSDPPAFVKAVEKARNDAAGKITQSGLFDSFIGGFGVKVDNEYPFGKTKVGGGDVSWVEAIERVGELNRGSLPDAYKAAHAKKVKAETDRQRAEAEAEATAAGKTLPKKWKPKLGKIELTEEEKAATYASTIDFYNTQRPGQVAEREKRLEEVDAALKGASGKEKQALNKERAQLLGQISEGKRDKRLAGIGLHDAATNPEKLAKILPTEEYAAIVSAALSKHLNAGHQVVGHMHNHFFRVEAVMPDGVIIDDPGSWTRRSYLMKWEEALKLGSFARFTWVAPK